MSGHDRPEQAVTFKRNGWSRWAGICSKLSETKTTYEKLLDEVRMELAIRLIQDGKLNLGRIAFELGFLDPSSFTRAFRRWTAMSPTAFREQFRQSDSTAL